MQNRANDAHALRYAALKDFLRSLPFLQNDAARKQAVESFAEWFKQAEPWLQNNADRDRALIARIRQFLAQAKQSSALLVCS
jgi:hypothetical protein